MPVGRLRERTIAWLDRAFVRGSASNGRLSYRGPVRKFPFRHGEGDFTATADARDVTLDYYPGFAPLTRAAGRASSTTPRSRPTSPPAEIGGDALEATKFAMTDYKAPVLDIDARGRGDVRHGARVRAGQPARPAHRQAVHGLARQWPGRYDVTLLLPILSDETRASLGAAAPRTRLLRARDARRRRRLVPALRAPAQTRHRRVRTAQRRRSRVPSLRGTILDGPFELEREARAARRAT